jgi:hypothetical protein
VLWCTKSGAVASFSREEETASKVLRTMHLLVWHDPTLNATTIIEEDHFGDLRLKGVKVSYQSSISQSTHGSARNCSRGTSKHTHVSLSYHITKTVHLEVAVRGAQGPVLHILSLVVSSLMMR